MARAIRNLCGQGRRGDLVIVLQIVLTNPAVDVCVTGPKDADQMREALKALELGPLSQEEMARMVRIGDYVYDHTARFF